MPIYNKLQCMCQSHVLYDIVVGYLKRLKQSFTTMQQNSKDDLTNKQQHKFQASSIFRKIPEFNIGIVANKAHDW